MRRILMFIGLLLSLGAQGQEKAGQVDIFCGADLYYGDTNFKRLYNVLLNLTPGVKWNMGHDWMLATQLSAGIVNDGYTQRQADFQLSMATLAKEWKIGGNHYVKATGGLFNKNRYGMDVRWMMPVTSWMMVQARAGVTNEWYLSFDEQTFVYGNWVPTATAGANFWIDPWATEFRVSGGRYMYEDWGVEAEAYCHFKHVSVGAFVQLHEKYRNMNSTSKNGTDYTYGGGFRVVMMLPPYKKSKERSTVRIRPASNFRLTYNAQSNEHSMKKYHTDPEENEREYQTKVQWGTGLYR